MSAGTYMYLLTCCSCIGGFLFGYDTGVISGALVSMKFATDNFNLTPFESETVVSSAIIGAILGAAAGGYGNDWVGRKPMILLSSALFTVGAIGMGLAPSFALLVLGRFIVGLAIGISSMTIPVYIAEASLPEQRGTLVSLNTLMVTGGQFFAAVFDGVLSTTPDGWRYMLGLVALPSAIQFAGFLYLPESPRWLMEKGFDTQAHAVLYLLRGDTKGSLVDHEWSQMQDAAATKDTPASASPWWAQLQYPGVKRALFLGCGLQVLQQLCGINTVMYYGATIVQLAGFTQPSTAIWIAALVAFSNFAFTFVGIYLVDRSVYLLLNTSWSKLADRSGRRPLTLWSLAGVVVSLVALGLAFYMAQYASMPLQGVDSCSAMRTCFDCVANAGCGVCGNQCVPGTPLGGPTAPITDCPLDGFRSCPSSSGWSVVIVVALFVYLACFASGMGCMPWTINAEIYPLHARSLAIGLATTSNWVSNLVVSYTFLTIVSVLAPYGAFWLYAAFASIGFVLVAKYLPETKGVSLEDIPLLFLPATHANYKPLH
ncbi:Aste57867_23201 [Aphanomyces stellatus]|uniref:Hexose transporter 1 n=1 Tax=Aphanomyces stellatus TaxID=120398 RepID=A0A485LNS3_9STRA|nr:hypothetical protein As57867_023130 [Aphanomyces stellatus]VFT99848.1 Aste57867_23201 [Aphanomyces stellatus]